VLKDAFLALLEILFVRCGSIATGWGIDQEKKALSTLRAAQGLGSIAAVLGVEVERGAFGQLATFKNRTKLVRVVWLKEQVVHMERRALYFGEHAPREG
jgi:hypothetical protein